MIKNINTYSVNNFTFKEAEEIAQKVVCDFNTVYYYVCKEGSNISVYKECKVLPDDEGKQLTGPINGWDWCRSGMNRYLTDFKKGYGTDETIQNELIKIVAEEIMHDLS